MQFAAKMPIALAVIGICAITTIFVAGQPSREGRRRPQRRRTGKGLRPGSACAGASSTAWRTPPDLTGSSERRCGQAGRHRNTVSQLGFVQLWLRSRGGCPLVTNRGPAVVADPLILKREEKPGAPLDDVAGTRLPLLEQPNSERRVSRNARNGPTLQRQRQSNMQFAAKTPIAVVVIAFCPITRTFVAPTTKSGGTAKTASDANRRVALS